MKAQTDRWRSDHKTSPFDRRSFLGTIGVAAATTVVVGTQALPIFETAVEASEVGPQTNKQRRAAAREVRRDAAQLAFDRPLPEHSCNGEEDDYPSRIGNYSKALPHDRLGEVDVLAYEAMLAALASGDPNAFEAIPLGGERKLTNPQAGLAFDLEGPDSHHLAIPPAPRIDSPEGASELAENYWMALARDVPFSQYDTDSIIAAAVDDLSRHFTDFRGPKESGRVTVETVFRGFTQGDLTGPYVSQFLLKEIPFGALSMSQRMETAVAGADHMTDFPTWLSVQNGNSSEKNRLDPMRRYIRNLRDLGQYVHVDALYEAYLNACLILLGMQAPLDPGNPYLGSRNQEGFGTFGSPHVLSLVTEVATRALKAVWYQKWFVHRRLRPEAFGGLVHNHLSGSARYPVHSELLHSEAPVAAFRRYGTYLVPMAYPEGSPAHPSYGAGHATVAGACVTILKAWFDESFVLPDPALSNAQGTKLLSYQGPDADSLTVGGELNKLAANIAFGRNAAGIHYRSDYAESVKLGEEVAIDLLEEQKATYNELGGFALTRFDGQAITI